QLRNAGQLDQAIELLEGALEGILAPSNGNPLAGVLPGKPSATGQDRDSNRAARNDVLVWLSHLLAAKGDSQRALDRARQAAAGSQSLVKAFPRKSEYREQLSAALQSLADRLSAAGHADEAAKTRREYLDNLTAIVVSSDNPQFRGESVGATFD